MLNVLKQHYIATCRKCDLMFSHYTWGKRKEFVSVYACSCP